MKLKELLKNVQCDTSCSLNVDVEELFIDSRKVRKNGAFFAIKGFNTDGHKYIKKAIENGASVVICEDYVDGENVIFVKNVRVALAKMCKNFYQNPSEKINLFGVTGTNGKTSVTYFLEQILMEYKQSVGLIGTIEIRTNQKKLEFDFATSTTPDTIELNEIFNKMIDKNIQNVVMEVSSHALELHKVDECRFDVAMFTNLTQDHLDMHKNMENYCKMKARLFTMCDVAVINCDDKYAKDMLKNTNCKVIKYSIENESDLQAKNIKYYMDKVSFDVDINGNMESFLLNIPAKFSVYNALCVIGASLSYGVPIDVIKKGIQNVKGVAGRIQTVQNDKGLNVIVDYAHTPDGLENIIKAVKEFTKGQVITIFGCGGDRDNKKRSIMGEISAKLSDYTIITSDNPRSEKPENIVDEIENGLKNLTNSYEKITDRKKAIFRGIGMASELDTVIIAGKGHEDYEIFADKVIHFDDTEVAREALEELK